MDLVEVIPHLMILWILWLTLTGFGGFLEFAEPMVGISFALLGLTGMHALVVGYEKLVITYGEVDGGAEIRYSSDDPDLVVALHEWFDAQVSDHGEHARDHR